MPLGILDINDSNLQLWHDYQQLQSPGYALYDGKTYSFGNTARAAARLHPRKINTRFWWQLNTQALQPSLGPARHTGDLAHAHLLDIYERGGKPDEIVLAVSGSLEREQLALILGIIEQCPFNAVGLVNRSVALASQYGGAGTLFHLEIQLHQAVVSELQKGSEQVELLRTIPLPGCGLLQLQERLVEMIASAFIRQTRFDPRRKADTEQLLYDALPVTLSELQGAAETNIQIGGYRARIARNELLTTGNRLFESVPEAMGSHLATGQIIVEPLAALLPGLREKIPQATAVTPDALAKALIQHMDGLVQREGALKFVTALPLLGEPGTPEREEKPETVTAKDGGKAASTPRPEPAKPAPTHLLCNAVARPLLPGGSEIAAGLEIYLEADRWLLRGEQAAGTRVNSELYAADVPLTAGDTIATPCGVSSQLISVQP